MSILTLSAKLDRTDNSTPWGFRLHGGKDFGAPLTIQRVTPGSLAAKCGLQVGDTIMKIGDAPTDGMRHKEAQQKLILEGNRLELALQRGGASFRSAGGGHYDTYPASSSVSAPAPAPYHQVSQPQVQPYSQNYNVAPKPFVPGGGGSVPVAMNTQYNTPIHMYSVDNVMDSLSHQTSALNIGAPKPEPIPPWRSAPSGPAHGAAAYGAPAHRPTPASGPAPWRPRVPTGPRRMRAGKGEEAKRMPATTGGGRVPICSKCSIAIRGPFVLALEKTWCPDHFICANPACSRQLVGVGFVEEEGQIFCVDDFKRYLAPRCGKCGDAIVEDCVNALNDTFHPWCFTCVACGSSVGQGAFHLEDGKIFCEKDWQSRFQTKCYGCQFPIEPGDRWVEALNQNWHSECFNCSTCQVNLEGQSFFASGGRPYCKRHASGGKRF